MKIVNNYSGVKVNVDIVFNEKLDSLLNQVPEHMKQLRYKDLFKEIIDYIVTSYSYLLPIGKEFNNIEFAEIIKRYYGLDSKRVRYVYDFLMNL